MHPGKIIKKKFLAFAIKNKHFYCDSSQNTQSDWRVIQNDINRKCLSCRRLVESKFVSYKLVKTFIFETQSILSKIL